MEEDLPKEKPVIYPTKPLLVFNTPVAPESIRGDDRFVRRLKLCLGEDTVLPPGFPKITDTNEAAKQGIPLAKDKVDSLLTLPEDMFNGNMYRLYPELRGPVEEIVFQFQAARVRNGLETTRDLPGYWSKDFRKRMKKLTNLDMTPGDIGFDAEMDQHRLRPTVDKPIQATKLA